ncbi:SAM-dependent methyltransferase [Nonomuraea sp. NPDC047897]|uniref:SAM-dependent methyltransferase n=1 Tax=Nonomuraea sp. NPDC047897 TaxID=3364346 RepID=UPI00371FDB14
MSGVGATAAWIAYARAAETLRTDRLFTDPLAVAFMERTNAELLAQLRASPTSRFDVLAVRTKYFDDYLAAALAAPAVRQVVLLAAGLDCRAFRLEWPAGTRLFELDLPEVLAEKELLVQECDFAPTSCGRHIVKADLTGDWPAALRAAGFDPDLPTAWLVEGLLYYLTAREADGVVRVLTRLSAAGSTLGLEHVNNDTYRAPWMQDWLAQMRTEGRAWKSGVAEPERWLAGHGWRAEVTEPVGVPGATGRQVPQTPSRDVPGVARTWLVTAHRTE